MAGKRLDKFHILGNLVADEIECFEVLDDLARLEDMAVFEPERVVERVGSGLVLSHIIFNQLHR